MAGGRSTEGFADLAAVLTTVVTALGVRKPPRQMDTRVIAVDGPGGAGKSTFAEHLAAALGGCQIAHTDDFATWENPIDWWPRLIDELLEPLSRNQTARFRRSQWQEGRDFGSVEIQPAEFVILEGVTASRQAFRPYLTYSVWIETPRELRLARGLARDRGSSRKQWEQWMAAEDGYRARERPDEAADLAVPGDQNLWA